MTTNPLTSHMVRDVFRPHRDPARAIYDAFQAEAAKRNGRTVSEWMGRERDAVLREAVFQAHKCGLRAPSYDEVVQAERSASGHTDYGAKWAYGVVEAMRCPPRA